MNFKQINQLMSLDNLKEFTDIFLKENCEIRFVGGCIRNILIGNKVSGIDFAINCDPEKTILILKKNRIKFNDFAKRYGSIHTKIKNRKIEITSLREDFDQKGRDTKVKFISDWKKDAQRRDFTMNALYLHPHGELFDFFDGQKDIAEQKVKFIGNIEKRVQEDYLRILRFYRFLGIYKVPNIINGYESIINKFVPNIEKYLKNEVIKNEVLKMFNNSYVINSFKDTNNPKEKNFFIKTIIDFWINKKNDLTVQKYIEKINNYF